MDFDEEDFEPMETEHVETIPETAESLKRDNETEKKTEQLESEKKETSVL